MIPPLAAKSGDSLTVTMLLFRNFDRIFGRRAVSDELMNRILHEMRSPIRLARKIIVGFSPMGWLRTASSSDEPSGSRPRTQKLKVAPGREAASGHSTNSAM